MKWIENWGKRSKSVYDDDDIIVIIDFDYYFNTMLTDIIAVTEVVVWH